MTPSWENTSVIIPTLNAEKHLDDLLPALARAGVPPHRLLVIDSSSRDDTVARFQAFGAQVKVIPAAEFNHGGTRRMAVSLVPQSEFLVFLTQDAIPAADDTITRILASFADAGVGMAYGRQLPRPVARGIERYARIANYGAEKYVRSFDDRARYGIKTVFCSNSFAAYRRTALEAVGNFPVDSYFAEDQTVSAHMLIQGWKIAYAADAAVYHSHDYTIGQDFRRYFDIGVFHCETPWMTQTFGKPVGEGMRIVMRELAYLARHEPLSVPSAILRAAAKLFGYKLGLRHTQLPMNWKVRLGMHGFYWKSRQAKPQ